MDAATQDTASRILTTTTAAGVAARDMDTIVPRAGRIPAAAGIAVSIQIMAPAIGVWRRAGRPGRRPRPKRAGLASVSRSAAHPNKATWSHAVAAGSDRQVMAIRAAHIVAQKTAGSRSAGRPHSARSRRGRAAPAPLRRRPP
jgi:hypothetical protein